MSLGAGVAFAPLPNLPALAPNGEVRPPKAAVRRARYRPPWSI